MKAKEKQAVAQLLALAQGYVVMHGNPPVPRVVYSHLIVQSSLRSTGFLPAHITTIGRERQSSPSPYANSRRHPCT